MAETGIHDEDIDVERQIALETIRKERAEAEARTVKAEAEAEVARMKAAAKIDNQREKQKARRDRANSRRMAVERAMRNRKSRKTILIFVSVLVIVVALFVTVIWPLSTYKPKTEYFTSSTLEKIVKTSHLSTVECIYNGIAEKDPTYIGPIQTNSGYSAKYNSRVKVSYDLAEVKIENEGNDKLVIYLPKPEIGDPVLDGELGFIPEGYTGDFSEALRICKDDAKQEVQKESSIIELADQNMERTMRALIEPLVGDNMNIEFKALSEYPMEANNEA